MEGSQTLNSLGEFGLIESLFKPLQSGAVAGVVHGIGDDAAVLVVPRTQQLLTTVDTLVEGIHFDASADPFRLGQKALLVNLSDIAAMGGNPCWYLLSLALPPGMTPGWMEAFVGGLRVVGERFGVTVVGGNTTASGSGCVINITLMGLVNQGRALTRAGSLAGDRILVSGTIGDAALALAMRQGRVPAASDGADGAYLDARLDLPEPRVALGLALCDAAAFHAAIDLSDGLVADLHHLCGAAKVGAVIDAERVPLSPAARRQLERDPGLLPLLLTGGEDYELLFTAPAGAAELLAAISRDTGVPLTDIGEMVAGRSTVEVRRDGQPLLLEQGGWRHF